MVKIYIEKIVELFRMSEEQKKYFLAKANPKPLQIKVLLDLRGQESLVSTVRAEQLGLTHPWECPNVSIQYSGHDGELLLVGMLGVNPELFDSDAPTFHVHKDRIGELVREFKNASGMESSEMNMDYIIIMTQTLFLLLRIQLSSVFS